MELLIALTLLGMLMAALFGGLHFGARVWQSSSERHEIQGRMTAVRSFLQQRLAEAEPVALTADGDRAVPAFAGRRNSLTLASSMPASLGPGVFLIDLELRRRDGEGAIGDLVVRWRPLLTRPADGIADAMTDGASERILIEDVAGVAMAYFGAPSDPPMRAWHEQWQGGRLMPELIRLDLQFPAGDRRRWSSLVVSPMVDEWYDPR